jgi:hypothetical protein
MVNAIASGAFPYFWVIVSKAANPPALDAGLFRRDGKALLSEASAVVGVCGSRGVGEGDDAIQHCDRS